jgi:hypothetical protein
VEITCSNDGVTRDRADRVRRSAAGGRSSSRGGAVVAAAAAAAAAAVKRFAAPLPIRP